MRSVMLQINEYDEMMMSSLTTDYINSRYCSAVWINTVQFTRDKDELSELSEADVLRSVCPMRLAQQRCVLELLAFIPRAYGAGFSRLRRSVR